MSKLYIGLKPLAVFTDSDAIMNHTIDIPSCIATIKDLLISRVIKVREIELQTT